MYWPFTYQHCSLNKNFQKLQALYSQHNYNANHIWNSNETRIQKDRQYKSQSFGLKKFKWGLSIPESWEKLTINYVVNAMGGVLLGFYIFKSEGL
jgi:hypothetical protein